MKEEEETVYVGNAVLPDDLIAMANAVFNGYVNPSMKQMLRVVTAAFPTLNRGLLVLFDENGRVATVCGTEEKGQGRDIDIAILALQNAIKLLETQKVKS